MKEREREGKCVRVNDLSKGVLKITDYSVTFLTMSKKGKREKIKIVIFNVNDLITFYNYVQSEM